MRMRHFQVAVLPGDGIGIEVTAEAVKVLQALGERDGGLAWNSKNFRGERSTTWNMES